MQRSIQSYRPFDRNFKEHTVSENTQDQHLLSIFHDLVSFCFFPAFHAENMHPGTPFTARNSIWSPTCKRNCTIINLKERGVKLFIAVKKGGKSMRRRSSCEEKSCHLSEHQSFEGYKSINQYIWSTFSFSEPSVLTPGVQKCHVWPCLALTWLDCVYVTCNWWGANRACEYTSIPIHFLGLFQNRLTLWWPRYHRLPQSSWNGSQATESSLVWMIDVGEVSRDA